jgi:hypothetical protein
VGDGLLDAADVSAALVVAGVLIGIDGVMAV